MPVRSASHPVVLDVFLFNFSLTPVNIFRSEGGTICPRLLRKGDNTENRFCKHCPILSSNRGEDSREMQRQDTHQPITQRDWDRLRQPDMQIQKSNRHIDNLSCRQVEAALGGLVLLQSDYKVHGWQRFPSGPWACRLNAGRVTNTCAMPRGNADRIIFATSNLWAGPGDACASWK